MFQFVDIFFVKYDNRKVNIENGVVIWYWVFFSYWLLVFKSKLCDIGQDSDSDSQASDSDFDFTQGMILFTI